MFRSLGVRIATAFVLVSAVFLVPARAQVEDHRYSFTPYVAYVDTSSFPALKNGPGYGLSITGAMTPYISLEGALLWAPDLEYQDFEQVTTTYRQARIQGLFHFNRPNKRVLPYFALGLGWLDLTNPAGVNQATVVEILRTYPDPERAKQEILNRAAYSGGWGITWGIGTHVFFTKSISLRIEARVFSSIGGSDFNNFEPFVGLSFWAGKSKQ
jgi:hypothetical protein